MVCIFIYFVNFWGGVKLYGVIGVNKNVSECVGWGG